jgi:Predicted xylanase/chitin deacetylase
MKGFAETANVLRRAGVCLGASAMYYSGGLTLLRAGFHRPKAHPAESSPFAILLYHRVNPDADPYFPAVSVKVFEAQMRYLAREFRVRSLVDVIDRIKQGDAVEPLTIAITFDDGYRDNYTFAHPILKNYRLPATLFVASGFIGAEELMWNDRLAWAIKNSQRKKLLCQMGDREVVFQLRTEEEKLASLDSILGELKSQAEAKKIETLESIIKALQIHQPQPVGLMLDWPSIREMAKQGWHVGSHTVTHQILTQVDMSRAAEELRQSKDVIEKELQCTVGLCAFPNGKTTDFNSDIKVLTRGLGYEAAVTTVSGMNGGNGDLDFYELRRRSVWESHLPTLACKLGYAYRRVPEYEKHA